MSSYLLYEPNHTLHAFTAAPEFQFHISDLRGKIIQNVNFSLVSQNSDSTLKLNLTRQHKFKSILGFQNKALNIKLLKFTQIKTIRLTSKNTIFNGTSFAKSETITRFVASKRVWEWSRILILSLGWPFTINEAKF